MQTTSKSTWVCPHGRFLWFHWHSLVTSVFFSANLDNNDLETNFQVSRDQDIYELLSNFVGKNRATFSCLLKTCLKWIIKELDQINTIYIYHLSHFEWYRTELYSSLVCCDSETVDLRHSLQKPVPKILGNLRKTSTLNFTAC